MRGLLAAAALTCAALLGAPALAQSSVVGTWAMTSEGAGPDGAPFKREATLTVSETGGVYAVDLTPSPPPGVTPPTITTSDAVVSGDTLTFKGVVTIAEAPGPIEIDYALTASGDALSGTATTPQGQATVTATRK